LRRIGRDELARLLHSKIRSMAEDGPQANRTPPDRVAYLVALGCVYIDADYTSVRELLLNAPGGIYIQRSPDPDLWARELYLDVWRARDNEIANATIMIVDAVCVDTNPTGRALSRLTAYLRPVKSEHQVRLDLPVRLGEPHRGELSGEFCEAMASFNAGAVPERRDRRVASEAWKGSLVRVILSEHREVRHVLPIDPSVADEIRRAHAPIDVDDALAALLKPGGPT
jgi:hypothetical protein